MKPLVSIIIAVCNGEKFISETLDSLVHQTISNWECWIVDDGSTDLTIEIVRNRCAIDARFNLLTTPGGNGPYIAANKAIPLCKADFVARIDADDIALPVRIELQLKILTNDPKINVCGSYYYYLFESGLVASSFETDSTFLKWQLLFRNRLVHSTMMFRKSWFVAKGLYPNKRLAQDWLIWIEALRDDSLWIVRQPLIKWRMHSESVTKVESKGQLIAATEVSVYAANVLISRSIPPDVSHPIISALRGKPESNSSFIGPSLYGLIDLWQTFLKLYKPDVHLRKVLRNEFIYFGFYLLAVNSKNLKGELKLIVALCKTEFTLDSIIWILRFYKRKYLS